MNEGAPSDALDDELPQGFELGRYRIENRLREGGMASIYVGRHIATEAKVAVKVLHRDYADKPEFVARFHREAQVMGRLSGSPHIVAVHDVGELDDGRGYLVMEFLRGQDLDDLLVELQSADETMAIDRACRIMRDVALGIEAAHKQQIVHRDLKPPNIMVEQRHGGTETAKVLDFGISADLGLKGRRQNLTSAGSVIGTPEYMAPEQAAGVGASPSFDVYALGVILFEVLTGRPPPARGWRAGGLPDIRKFRPDVPTAVVDLIRDTTHYDATRRTSETGEVIERLGQILSELDHKAADTQSWSRSRPGEAAGELEASSSHSGAFPAQARRGPPVIVSPALGEDASASTSRRVRLGGSGTEPPPPSPRKADTAPAPHHGVTGDTQPPAGLPVRGDTQPPASSSAQPVTTGAFAKAGDTEPGPHFANPVDASDDQGRADDDSRRTPAQGSLSSTFDNAGERSIDNASREGSLGTTPASANATPLAPPPAIATPGAAPAAIHPSPSGPIEAPAPIETSPSGPVATQSDAPLPPAPSAPLTVTPLEGAPSSLSQQPGSAAASGSHPGLQAPSNHRVTIVVVIVFAFLAGFGGLVVVLSLS